MADDARLQTIAELAQQVNKKYGENTMILGSQAKKRIDEAGRSAEYAALPRISTGILAFDLALGGGWPKNQWSEIIAIESHGKTSIALKTIAHNQRLDPDFIALWIAAEEWVPELAIAIGVDLGRMWLVESNEMEPCLNLVVKAVENRAVDLVVLDSIPAFITISEIDKDLDEPTVATSAKILSTFFKKCRRVQRRSMVVDERGCTMLALNQWRDMIGVKYGDPRTTPGGKAKNYEFFVRLELTRDEWIAEGSKIEDRVGQVIKMRTIKNKTSAANRVAQVDFYFTDTKNGAFHLGEFDTVKDIVNVSIALGVIKRAGGTYTFMDEKWRGKDCAKVIIPAAVREDLDLRAALTKACHEAYAKGGLPPEEDESDEPD